MAEPPATRHWTRNDVRCPVCGHLVTRSLNASLQESVCERCGALLHWSRRGGGTIIAADATGVKEV